MTALMLLSVGSGGLSAEASTRRDAALQPGSQLVSPVSQRSCTGGFIAQDRAGAVYMLLGSDCAPYGSDGRTGNYTVYYGSRTWKPGAGPAMNVRTKDYQQRQVGRFVAQHKPGGDAMEYSVLRLDRGRRWSASVPEVGPTAAQPWKGSMALPTAVTYVCSDGSKIALGSGTDEATYDSGVRQTHAPLGVTERTFPLAEGVNASCEGAPVVMSLGDGRPVPVGVLHRALNGQVVRLNSILADAASRFGLQLTLRTTESGVVRR